MKKHRGKILLFILALLVFLAALGVWLLPLQNGGLPETVQQTRLALRQQGFKTDLADFNFFTSPDLRAREAALTFFFGSVHPATASENLNLLPAVRSDSAIVIWQQDWLPAQDFNGQPLHWQDLGMELDSLEPQLNDACDAALSGPIAFNLDASRGNGMLLRHLALLKRLTQTLGVRVIFDLHQGNADAAWTNLLAETRLVTAWNPEPTEVSHLVRFACASLAYTAAWQALQTNAWRDEQLARLQHEWESADFFTNLPDTAAFQRAGAVDMCQRERNEPFVSGFSFSWFVGEAFRSPQTAWGQLRSYWSRLRYRNQGTYEDEIALLQFYQRKELELRRVIQSATWLEMKTQPGATNFAPFMSKYPSRLQSLMNLKELSPGVLKRGISFPGRAAEAETRRRIILTAIALERYRGRHGACPKSLAELTPEFLRAPVADFMDGQPLRYRLTDDGHFVLYSVGLDGVDDGGRMPARPSNGPGSGFDVSDPFGARPDADIVWPRPATAAEINALRQQEIRANELQSERELEQESAEEWIQSPLRQARTAKILAMQWSPNARGLSWHGRPLTDDIHNDAVTGTNRLSLVELLTPTPIITGHEPEDLTFELPINYEVVTNRGGLALLVDADPNVQASDSGARMQEFQRAANGDCLLVWHTIFDPPGQHAVQVELSWSNEKGGYAICRGPAIPVVTTNLCQFSLASSHFDMETGATLHGRLPEPNASYNIELNTTNGTLLKTISGTTSNGEINVFWNLIDDHGRRFTNDFFNSVFHITLTGSGRSQTLKGP